ncbi:MAG: NUDIX hydrolase [Gemmobacter sp.]|nr:NUDIX hydrolase [Gemmobacter sp.]
MMENLRNWLRGIIAPLSTRPPALQVAALCLRDGTSEPDVLLVRSLDTRRWIIPKGWPMPGRTLSEAAAIEAWEEAGVKGRIDTTACTSFGYAKRKRAGMQIDCEVQVFRLMVDSLADSYPEAGKRERKWVPASKAASNVREPELRAYLVGLSTRGGSL